MATIETLMPVLDLSRTFFSAISGADAAVNRRLDVFGILIPAFVCDSAPGFDADPHRSRLICNETA